MREAEYAVRCGDFRETLAAARGQATLIAMSPPYPDARTCYESLEWEDYQALGDAVKAALGPLGDPETRSEAEAMLRSALAAVQEDDSDGDGHSNIAEIAAGAFPGDEKDIPG